MIEQTVFRIKKVSSNGYWNGQGFGTGGKIYTKRKYAVNAMSDGRLGNAIDKGVYSADDIKVVKATIIEE